MFIGTHKEYDKIDQTTSDMNIKAIRTEQDYDQLS